MVVESNKSCKINCYVNILECFYIYTIYIQYMCTAVYEVLASERIKQKL